MTKISSHDAPAIIICGIDCFVPYFSSINCTMRGTTTAGETAASTVPITAASIREISKKIGANSTYPTISNDAGTKASKIAGLPTFFKSFKFNDKPALSKMIINAILRSSAEIDKIDESRKSSTYGPSTIPVTSIPIMRGSFNFWHIAAIQSPTKKISANDVNIFFSSFNGFCSLVFSVSVICVPIVCPLCAAFA